MLGLSPLLSLLVVVLVALIARQLPEPRRRRGIAARILQVLERPWVPLVIAVLTGLATWYVWGSLNRSAVVHDESAYLLQAELFSKLRFTAPTPRCRSSSSSST